MPNLTSVGITNGIPTSGTGTVSTLDAVLAQITAGNGYSSGKVSITRPANVTAYAANDIVVGAITLPLTNSNNGNAASACEFQITSAILELDISALPSNMVGFYLHLYSSTPTSAFADNAAFDLTGADRAAYLCKLTFSTPFDEGSTLRSQVDLIGTQITIPAGGVLFGYLVTIGGFTPANVSEVYAVVLKGVQV